MSIGIRVLMIDDDPIARGGIATYLRTIAKFEVSEVENGQAALAVLAKDIRFTAIFLDYVLDASATGESVFEEIHSKYPQLPVIVVTGKDPVGGLGTLGKGAYRFLRRPLDPIEIEGIIRSVAEQDMVFHAMSRDIKHMLHADVCIAWKLDKRQNGFRIAAWDSTQDLNKQFRQNAMLNVTDLQEFVKKGKPRFFSNVQDPRIAPNYKYRDIAINHHWLAMVSIPLLWHDRIIGIIDSYFYHEIDVKSQRKQFQSELRFWSNQAVDAIRNAQLSARMRQMQGISTLLAGTHDEDSIIHQIMGASVEMVGADAGWLYLRDFETHKLKRMTWHGVEDTTIAHERALGVGITGWVAAQGIAYLASDVSKDSIHEQIIDASIGSEIAVPLRREELTIGVLTAVSRFANLFTNDDVDTLMALATQATIAITRAKLTKHLQEITQLALIGDYERLAKYTVKALQDLTGADVCLLRVEAVDGGRNQVLSIVACQGEFPQVYRDKKINIPLDPDVSLSGRALSTGKPVIRKNLMDEMEMPKAFLVPESKEYGWQGFMAIPLLGREGEKLGSLSIHSREYSKFVEADAELLKPFVNQVAIALQQQKHSDALHLLAEIGEVLTGDFTNDPKSLMNQIAEAACKLLGADCAAIYPYDPTRLQFYESSMIGTARLLFAPQTVTNKPRTSGLAAKVRELKELIIYSIEQVGKTVNIASDNINNDSKLLSEITKQIVEAKFIQREQIKAFVAISLIAGETAHPQSGEDNQEVGVLYINFRSNHKFSIEELQLIRIFGHQVANVIRGTRLFIEARRRVTELNIINQTILQVLGKATIYNVLDALVVDATRLLGAIGGILYLTSQDRKELVLEAITGVNSLVLKKGFRIKVGQGLAGKVFQSKKTLAVENYSSWEHRILEIEPNFTAILGVPLLLGEIAIGVIAVADDIKHRSFTLNDVSVLERFASQATLAFHSSRIYEEAQRRIVDLEIVNRIAEVISNKLKTNEILEEVVKQLHQQLGCSDCTIFLAERSNNQDVLVPKAAHGKHSPLNFEYRFAPDQGIAGRVFRHNHAENVHNVYVDPDFLPEKEERTGGRSMLAVPIRIGEQVIGVLCADHEKYDGFSDSDKHLVEAIARHIGFAIERANGLELLQSISNQIIGATQVDIILEQIAFGAVKLARASSCGIYLVDEGYSKIIRSIRYPANNDHPFPRFSRKRGLTYLVVTKGDEIVIPDVSKDNRVHSTLRKHKFATITLPVKVNDRTIGAIHINALQNRSFSEIELSLLRTLASQASAAIQKAHLFEQEQKLRQQAETLYEVSTAIAANLEVSSLLELIVMGAVRLTNTDSGIIHLIDKDKQTIRQTYEYPLGFGQPSSRFQDRRGYAWKIYNNRESCEVSDVQRDRTASKALKALGVKAMLGVPLKQEDIVIGVLFLNSKKNRTFSSDEKASLMLLSEQAALAIGRAELFRQIQHQQASQIKTISEITKSIPATSSKQLVLDSVIEWTVALFGEDCIGDVRLLNEERNAFVVRSNIGKNISVIRRIIPLGEGITGAVARERATMVFDDVLNDDRYLGSHRDGVRSRIAVPMFKGSEVIGVLNIDNPRIARFSENDAKLAEAIAGLVIVALENAELYEKLLQKIGQQAELYRVGVSITLQNGLDDVLSSIAQSVNTLVHADFATIFPYDARNETFGIGVRKGKFEDKPDEPRRNGYSIDIVKSQTSEFVEDASKHQRKNLQFLESRQLKSWASIPLIYRARSVGVMHVNFTSFHYFTSEEKELLQLLANQAAVAIENAVLYADMERQVRDRTEELQLAQERTQEAMQLAVLGRVGARFAHQINNLAGTIPVRIAMAKECLEKEPIQLQNALHQLDILSNKTNTLLDAATELENIKGNEAVEPVDIHNLLTQGLEYLLANEPEINTQIRIVKNFVEQIPSVLVVRNELFTTFVDIMQNALDAMQNGGTFVISTNIIQKQDEQYAQIDFSDSGSGISDQAQQHVFELFYSTKKAGLGFGLWRARNFMQEIGGDIRVWSKIGTGTTFELTIPLKLAVLSES